MKLLRDHLRILRLLVAAWMIAGLVLQPVLAALGDLHELDHLAEGCGDHAQGDFHAHDHADHRHGDDPGDGSGSHTGGLHSLLHSFAGMNGATLPDLPSIVGTGPIGSLPPQRALDQGRIAGHPNSPFRPPIA